MNTLRVATLNIWNRSGPWVERLAAIRSEIERLSPDVLALQEVLRGGANMPGPDQLGEVAKDFGFHEAYGASWDLGGMQMGNAILSRFPIARSHTLLLSGVDADDKRSLLGAELQTPVGPIAVFSTHLSFRFDEGHIRERQVQVIAEHITKFGTTCDGLAFPPILMGDFNAVPDSTEMRYLRGLTTLSGKSAYFADVFGNVGKDPGRATYSRQNPYAAALHEPSRRIDYIFVRGVSPAGWGEPLDADICFDRPGAGVDCVEGAFPSDHFGVVATLRSG